MVKIKVLEAFQGDCFIISFEKTSGNNCNILIDGGMGETYYNNLKDEILNIKENGENIDIIIITHTDDDHIEGIIRFFEDSDINKEFVKRVIYNSAKALSNQFKTKYDESRELEVVSVSEYSSYNQGNTFEKLLKKNQLLELSPVKFGDEINIDKMKIKIISPTVDALKELNCNWKREEENDLFSRAVASDYDKSIEELQKNRFIRLDTSLANKSSIAFIIEVGDFKILMLADSHPKIIVSSLRKMGYSKDNKLKVDYIKLSHHGSKKNLTYELLDMIDCSNYIISTDGQRHGHPNKESLARILKKQKNVKFYYNYKLYNDIFTSEEINKYNFENKLISVIDIRK